MDKKMLSAMLAELRQLDVYKESTPEQRKHLEKTLIEMNTVFNGSGSEQEKLKSFDKAVNMISELDYEEDE